MSLEVITFFENTLNSEKHFKDSLIYELCKNVKYNLSNHKNIISSLVKLSILAKYSDQNTKNKIIQQANITNKLLNDYVSQFPDTASLLSYLSDCPLESH
jgi:hypothetical protein